MVIFKTNGLDYEREYFVRNWVHNFRTFEYFLQHHQL
jgi:hypothetical protein